MLDLHPTDEQFSEARPARRFHSPGLFLPHLLGDIWFALYRKRLFIKKQNKTQIYVYPFLKDVCCRLHNSDFKPRGRAWTKEKFRTNDIWANKKNPFVQERNKKEERACLCPKMSHSVSEDLAEVTDITLGISQNPSCLGNKSHF